MGSCISSYSPHSTLNPPSLFPCTSKAWSFRGKEMKRRRKNGNDVNNGSSSSSSSRRPAITGGKSGGCGLVEEELQHVPGRLFQNGSSDVACLYTQQGKKGTNQDAMLVWENFASKSDIIFCGVFDGHGPCGHMVSKKVRDSLPLKLYANWTRGNGSTDNSPRQNGFFPGSMDFEETASSSIADEWCPQDVNENEELPEMYLTLRQSFLKAFMLTDKELKFHPTIDCFCSGSTAVTVIKQGQDLVIGNVGDSRAILGTRDNDNNLVAVQLTVDLKPNLPREAARIQQCNGRVFALQDEPEVARVWLPNNDSPGLAMARAFGDFCLKDYGLISVPDISYRRLTEKDEFIVLATDGIWDALSNKEVINIVSSAPTRGTAARALVDSAVRSWRLKFPTSKIDDCAAICLFLDPQPSPHESPKESTEQISLASVSQEEAMNGEVNTQMNEEVDESATNVAQTLESSNSTTPLDADEIVPITEEPKHDSKSGKSLADCISTTDEEEWTALEGITRVNSLLNMPRFLSGEKKNNWRKWL